MRAPVYMLVIWLVVLPWASHADSHHVTPNQTGFTLTGMDESEPSLTSGGGPTPAGAIPGAWHHETQCAVGLGGLDTCAEPARCHDGTLMTYTWFETPDGTRSSYESSCPEDAAVAASPAVTPGLVLRAFRRVPLPASELVVQPPGGRTLVNFETNFYTERGELTRVVRLLGRRVELRIWPEAFTWQYGDGVSERTRGAGSPYPDLEITHRYLRRGRVVVRVDTTYAADFRVGAGGWRHVDGTVTIPGAAEGLRVVTARPVLVGG
ncbi:hypothetical protein Noca_1511 [Nocardioides sp. JS614]|nr:hypothetical protein Noca_1511 [Nocardioides sp. JS614]